MKIFLSEENKNTFLGFACWFNRVSKTTRSIYKGMKALKFLSSRHCHTLSEDNVETKLFKNRLNVVGKGISKMARLRSDRRLKRTMVKLEQKNLEKKNDVLLKEVEDILREKDEDKLSSHSVFEEFFSAREIEYYLAEKAHDDFVKKMDQEYRMSVIDEMNRREEYPAIMNDIIYESPVNVAEYIEEFETSEKKGVLISERDINLRFQVFDQAMMFYRNPESDYMPFTNIVTRTEFDSVGEPTLIASAVALTECDENNELSEERQAMNEYMTGRVLSRTAYGLDCYGREEDNGPLYLWSWGYVVKELPILMVRSYLNSPQNYGEYFDEEELEHYMRSNGLVFDGFSESSNGQGSNYLDGEEWVNDRDSEME